MGRTLLREHLDDRERWRRAMATYEISTSGGPACAPQTLLHLCVRDTAGLEAALRRLADLGLELLEVRRTPGPSRPGTRSGRGAEPSDAHGRRHDLTFEARVRGRVGPVLLHAIPHAQAAATDGRATVVVQAPDGRPLAEVLTMLLAPADRLESVRRTGPVTSGARALWGPARPR